MRELRSILLATDYRQASREAQQWAARIAQRFEGQVTVLHALEITPATSSTMIYRKQIAERLHAAYVAELEALGANIASATIEFGAPVTTIVEKANDIDADLIIIGAGERLQDNQFAAGPVAEAVMQHARQPVLAVLPGRPASNVRKILCPVDFSQVSQRGIRMAAHLAQAVGGQLVILTVIPELSWMSAAVETGVLVGAKQQHEMEWQEEFDRFLRDTHLDLSNAAQKVRIGNPATEIVRAAVEQQADLIVMGATGRTGLLQVLMGSVTRRVLQHLPCSILTVHDEDMLLEAIDEASVESANVLFSEAKSLMADGAPDAALGKLDQLLARFPYHVGAMEARAQACETLGQQDRAERCRRRAAVVRQITTMGGV